MAFAPKLTTVAPDTPKAYDKKTDSEADQEAKHSDYSIYAVKGCDDPIEALEDTSLILSLVTADEAVNAAQNAAEHIGKGALYCDMNSVAPQSKKIAAQMIDNAGGHYIDVAIMAPVYPPKENVPLLVSGSNADKATDALKQAGFTNVQSAGEIVGQASTIKMCRSIIIKGTEALTAEAMLAAQQAGVRNAVVTSMPPEWADRADYNLDRMMVHGRRRAAEMDEVVKTLEALDQDASMARATADWQRQIGELGLVPAEGLRDKLKQIVKGERL
ncbi:MAG: DUF1932 domain-containing protein [Parasphingorhabdus sp.]